MSSRRLMLAVILIAFASLCQQASARIGETPEQCQTRYGKPIAVDNDEGITSFTFKKASIIIDVYFYNGKADTINFHKVNSKGKCIALSENEVQYLLETNSGGIKWKEPKILTAIGDKLWETEDGKIRANYSNGPDYFTLHIETEECNARLKTELKDWAAKEDIKYKAKVEAKDKKIKAEVKKSLEGF